MIVAAIRIADILRYAIKMSLFDKLRMRGKRDHRMASLLPAVAPTGINYVELLVCFALIYVTQENWFSGNGWNDVLYFSAISQVNKCTSTSNNRVQLIRY